MSSTLLLTLLAEAFVAAEHGRELNHPKPDCSLAANAGAYDCRIPQTSGKKLPLHVIAFIGLAVSVICGCTMIYKGLQMGKDVLMKSPAKRLPMYIAAGDVMFSAFHWADHMVTVTQEQTPHFPGCTILAWGTYGGIMVSVFGAAFLAGFACYRLLIEPMKEPHLGPFDVGPLLFFYGIPLLLCGLTYLDGAMGYGTSWCILGGGEIKEWAGLGWFILPICLVMGFNIVTYGAIFLKLGSVVANIGDNPTSRHLIKFMTEMKAYVAIYVFAFIPIATTTIMGVYYGYIDTTGYYALALDYVVVCTVNLNGTLNCIAFVWFSSSKGKQKLEERATRNSVAMSSRGSAYTRDSIVPNKKSSVVPMDEKSSTTGGVEA